MKTAMQRLAESLINAYVVKWLTWREVWEELDLDNHPNIRNRFEELGSVGELQGDMLIPPKVTFTNRIKHALVLQHLTDVGFEFPDLPMSMSQANGLGLMDMAADRESVVEQWARFMNGRNGTTDGPVATEEDVLAEFGPTRSGGDGEQ